MELYRRWEAWGTYVHLAVRDPHLLDNAEAIARYVIRRVGAACSRFDPGSDLSRVNRSAGRWVKVNPLLVGALEVAVEAARETDGLVNPCLGRTLVSLGYDTDLDVVRRRADADATIHHVEPAPVDAWQDIETRGNRVRIPTGVSLDLGSTAKAWTTDLIAAWIAQDLGAEAVISLGGDVAIAGWGSDWPIAISEDPTGPPDSLVCLGGGGLATSSVRRRRWTSAGVERHHLVDPRTGLPTTGPWRTVTATGPTCLAANIASTVAIVLGPDAEAWLKGRAVDARLIHADGSLQLVGSWPRQVTREPA